MLIIQDRRVSSISPSVSNAKVFVMIKKKIKKSCEDIQKDNKKYNSNKFLDY